MLQHALIALIQKMDYDAITIKDICEEADVSRSTFYAHFNSKDDLKRAGLDHLRRLMVAQQNAARGPATFGFSLTLFEHARDHPRHYQALAGGRGSAVAFATIRESLSDLVRRELAATDDEGSAYAVPREVAAQFVVGAYMAVLAWWLDGGAKFRPKVSMPCSAAL